MERPAAIVRFERFYLGALGLKVIFAIVNWSSVDAAALQIGIILSLLLWFGVAYRHSVISKWLIIVMFIGTSLWTCFGLAIGRYDVFFGAVAAIAMILYGIAAWQLLHAGADRWFDRAASEEVD
jgi:hypothetical protein